MNLADLPTFQEQDIDKLKVRLEQVCEEQQISRFEADDIVELLEDGESVDWIMEQLQGENPSLDVDKTRKLLSDIHAVVAPEEDDEDEEIEDIVAEETPAEMETPDLSDIDLSQIDMSQFGNMLPEGMTLPRGIDMNQLQKVMDSPQGKFMTDFTLFCQEQGVDIASMNDPRQMQDLDAQWKATPRQAFEGKTPAEMLEEDPTLMPQKVETFRRDEPRVGRNDPCPCGSGKKYKKCCGRGK